MKDGDPTMDAQTSKQLAHNLITWYRANARDLPFRHSRDPYRIFISEMMLQQTQVATMLPYYERFIARFPDIETLAQASLDDVLSHWQGLGYYRRAKHVHEAAKQVCATHGGQFPTTLDALKALPGIGDYTAGAIASIAFNQPEPAIDGNVLRVLTRVLAEARPIALSATKATVKDVVRGMHHHAPPRELTQAIMELGALVCVRTPICEACPLQRHCLAYAQGRIAEIPMRAPRLKQPLEHYIAFVITGGDAVYLEQNPDKGLLANLYGLPHIIGSDVTKAYTALQSNLSMALTLGETLGEITHVFSHKRWRLTVIHATSGQVTENFHALDDLPAIGKAHRKAIALWEEKMNK